MPYKNIKRYAKAVYSGTKDYRKQVKQIDREAERRVGKSGDRITDIKKQQKERRRIMKKRNVSFINSVKNRL